MSDLKERCAKTVKDFGGALVEKYVEGREFTVFIVGNKKNPHVFSPVEYIFDGKTKFITFEDKWGSSYTHSHWKLLDRNQNKEEQKLIDDLISFTLRLYQSFNGDGYARMDFRQDQYTKELFVLDCNSNCSLFYEDSCSADLILELNGWTKAKLMKVLLDCALERQRQYHLTHAYTIKYSPKKGYAMYAARKLSAGDIVSTVENSSLKLITKHYALDNFSEQEISWFDHYGEFRRETGTTSI